VPRGERKWSEPEINTVGKTKGKDWTRGPGKNKFDEVRGRVYLKHLERGSEVGRNSYKQERTKKSKKKRRRREIRTGQFSHKRAIRLRGARLRNGRENATPFVFRNR